MNRKETVESMREGINYHDKRAGTWSDGYEVGAFKRRFAFLSSYLSVLVKPGARWLDAGCGSGVLSRELGRLGGKVVGVDASSRMVEAAKLESKTDAVDVDYRVIESIEHLDLSDALFDGVLCSSVVEYLSRPEYAFAEFSRVLVSGGHLVLTVPNRLSLIRNAQKIARAFYAILGKSCCTYLDVSINEYTKAGIERALISTGFEIDITDIFDPVFFSLLGRSRFGSLYLICARKV